MKRPGTLENDSHKRAPGTIPRIAWVGVAVAALITGACDLKKPAANTVPGATLSGAGVGQMCVVATDCRAGLLCQSGACQPSAMAIPGANCALSAECLPGNYCAPAPPTPECLTGTGGCFGKCQPKSATPQPANGVCSNEGDCADGLTCALTGLSGACVATGLGDYGAPCSGQSDCRGGLICAAAMCKTAASVKPWAGAMCPNEAMMPAAAHFHVPRATDPANDDFYALPFPNDIRIKGGKISMAGFPKPGLQLLPFDPVDRYTKAIEADISGFGTNAVVFFRFTHDQNFGSFQAGGVMGFVDITPGADRYGLGEGFGWNITNGGGKFICPHYLVAGTSAPLAPGHTYAVTIKKGVTDSQGVAYQRDADFDAMLAATAPVGDVDLAAAWTAYAPLRAYITDKALVADDFLVASVFTTQKAEDAVTGMRTVVGAMPATALAAKGIVKCGDPAAHSPCDDGLTGVAHVRGCPATPDPAFDEYQGTVAIPTFQAGTPPYDMDGGGLVLDATGVPAVQRSEDVCFSLSVPKGAAPATGWPVVVYAHGTGGDYRSAVTLGHASDLASVVAVPGTKAPMAVLGYDGVLHGTRKGVSTKDSDTLVFNILNPPAARGNALQAAADLFALARYVREGLLGVAPVVLDPAAVALYGHSQGGNAAALGAAYEPGWKAVVMSGTGAFLSQSLMEKKKPVDVADALPNIFGEPVTTNHPFINLIQTYFDAADQINTAHRFVVDVPMGTMGKHILHIYGQLDSYAPPSTQRLFAQTAQLPMVGPVLDDIVGLVKVPTGPVTKNAGLGNAFTIGHMQYAPTPDYDGHFVSTRNPAARAELNQFLGSFAATGTPTLAF